VPRPTDAPNAAMCQPFAQGQAMTKTPLDYESLTHPLDPEVEFPERLREARKQRLSSIITNSILILALSSPLWVFLIFKLFEYVDGF
jgi:hypothetical protein